MKQRAIRTPEMPLASLRPIYSEEAANSPSEKVASAPPPPEIELPASPSVTDAGAAQVGEVTAAHPTLGGTVVGHDNEDAPSSVSTDTPPGLNINQPKSIQAVPLSRMRFHPFNSRVLRTQGRIEEVKDMLEAEHKQREPITLVPGRKPEDIGIFYILSGQTRYHSANLAGWSELDAQFNYDVDPDNHLQFWTASLEHNTSAPETDWDLAIRARALADEGHPQEALEKGCRRDARGLRRLLAMTELPENIQALVKENPLKLSASFCETLKSGISDLGDEEIATFARRTIAENLTQRQLQDQINKAKQRKLAKNASSGKRSTRESMVPVMVGASKAGEFKVMQSRDEGKKVLTLTANVPESLVEAFKADIQSAIDKLAHRNGELGA